MTTTTAPPTPPPPRRRRRTWTLQTRLMATVIGFVAALLIAIALATGAILSSILQQSLDPGLIQAVQGIHVRTDASASDVLNQGRDPAGFLLVLRTTDSLTGAYVGSDESVQTLTIDQIQELASGLGPGTFSTVSVTGLGDYRVLTGQDRGLSWIVGLPMSETTATLARILTTVALVTVGGLLILATILAAVIRRSLRPLRAVADTAERVATMPLSEGEVQIAERVPIAQADERTEIGRVGAALNTLLDHVGVSLEKRQRNEERMRQFVADASHELRTPLASIRGYSELSLRALRKAPAADGTGGTTTAALERIQAQSLRMSALVEDLLLLARLEEGQELVYGTVDLSRLAIEAVGDAQVAGPDHGWTLDVGEEPVVIAGDESRLHQVVANLLANARTHTPAGTTVTVSVAQEDKEAILRVEDDGPGIDPAIADELFERFSRADRSRARQTGGTGLGLSIARAIVEAHHGTIDVESKPGRTVFTVRLPARPATPA
ncbi:ATP-binding protein [Microbacterium sp. X-17]|uniref:sensor histidine kinase n=1 Tax=Microbacterium sp. X-17 TaxID=3144404 RepID=UPI0031F5BFAD